MTHHGSRVCGRMSAAFVALAVLGWSGSGMAQTTDEPMGTENASIAVSSVAIREPVANWQHRKMRLESLGTGVIVLRSSGVPNTQIIIKKHQKPHPSISSDWRVDFVPDDGSPGWSWQDRWGLPERETVDKQKNGEGAGAQRATVVSRILGQKTYASIDDLWRWVEGYYTPDNSTTMGATLIGLHQIDHRQWAFNPEVGFELPGYVEVGRLGAGDDEKPVRLDVQQIELRSIHEKDTPLGWPFEPQD